MAKLSPMSKLISVSLRCKSRLMGFTNKLKICRSINDEILARVNIPTEYHAPQFVALALSSVLYVSIMKIKVDRLREGNRMTLTQENEALKTIRLEKNYQIEVSLILNFNKLKSKNIFEQSRLFYVACFGFYASFYPST